MLPGPFPGIRSGEMADQLCVSALATLLRIQITVIRYDARAAPEEWMVYTHGGAAGALPAVIGNDNGHYVPLLPDPHLARGAAPALGSDSE